MLTPSKLKNTKVVKEQFYEVIQMDTEETHEDAPRDEDLYENALHILHRYVDMMKTAKKIGHPIEPSDAVGDAVYVSFAEAVTEAGYTEDAGFTHPRTLWDKMLKEAGL